MTNRNAYGEFVEVFNFVPPPWRIVEEVARFQHKLMQRWTKERVVCASAKFALCPVSSVARTKGLIGAPSDRMDVGRIFRIHQSPLLTAIDHQKEVSTHRSVELAMYMGGPDEEV